MKKHYYRQSRSRSRTRKPLPRSTTWLWILFGVLIGVGGSALGYLFLIDQKSVASRLSQPKPSAQKIAKKEKESAQRFEFYTLLPGMEIQLPDANPSAVAKTPQKPVTESVQVVVQPQASPAPPPPPTISQTAEPKHPVSPTKSITTAQTSHSAARPPNLPSSANSVAAQYIVQAGIFQELQHADALKARLTLQGFNTQIQKVQTQEGHAWFRVTLGPFASESLALHQKKRLEDQKIHGILILQRPNS